MSAVEIVNDDMILTGESVTVDGTINGDVFVAANTLFVNGTINGTLVGAARTIVIKGDITGAAFAAGDSVIVSGRVGRSLVTASSTAIVEPGASVGHSWVGASDRLEHRGDVRGGMAIATGALYLRGRVGKDVRAAAGRTLEVSADAEVVGPLTYYSARTAHIAPGARLAEVVYHPIEQSWRIETDRWFLRPWLVAAKFGGFVLARLVVLTLLPGLRTRFPAVVASRPWQAPLAGFLSLLALPVAAVLLMLTVIGIPLGVLALVSVPAVVYVGQVLISWTVGQFLSDRIEALRDQRWPVVFLVGALATTLAIQVPVVGPVIAAALFFAGLGGLYYAAVQRESQF